jgi:hypothetical protein
MDNAQNSDNNIKIASSQTYRTYSAVTFGNQRRIVVSVV